MARWALPCLRRTLLRCPSVLEVERRLLQAGTAPVPGLSVEVKTEGQDTVADREPVDGQMGSWAGSWPCGELEQ